MIWFWLALTIALVVVELSTTQLVSVWFACGSAITAITIAIVTSCGGNLPVIWQIVIFVVTTTAILVSTRPLVKRFSKRTSEHRTNLELNIDQTAVVVETIDNIKGQGAIKLNGLEWSARSLDNTVIEKDEIVIFKEIKGNKALVIKK